MTGHGTGTKSMEYLGIMACGKSSRMGDKLGGGKQRLIEMKRGETRNMDEARRRREVET